MQLFDDSVGFLYLLTIRLRTLVNSDDGCAHSWPNSGYYRDSHRWYF